MSDMSFQNVLKSSENFLQNKYVSAILLVFFILYGSLVAPKLPPSVAKLFDYSLVRLVVFFLIAYLASANPTIALVAALAVFITLLALQRLQMTESFVERMVVGSCGSGKKTPAQMASGQVPAAPSANAPAPAMPASSMPAASEVVGSDSTSDATVVTPMAVQAPKQVVTDQNGQPVKDASGKMAVAPPTVVQDDNGNVVKDQTGQPAVVAPKAAVDANTGKPAMDKNGKVVVAPPKIVTDESSVPVKNVEGNYMVVPCEVTIQDDGSIYVVKGPSPRAQQHGRNKGIFGVYQNEATPAERQLQDMSAVCNGSACFQGFDNGNDLASF